jgi:hypothetical protein
MTTEHKRRASEGSSTKRRSIPTRDFPSPSLSPGSAFIPNSSSILPAISHQVLNISNRFWLTNRSYRKQKIKPLLTGSRFAHKLLEIRQVSTQNLAPEDLQKTPKFSDSRAFLPGSAQNVENDVTYSKQRIGEFLPGATTHHSGSRTLQRDASRARSKSSNIDGKFLEEIAWLLQ